MRKIVLFISAFLLAAIAASNAQTIYFSENFEGVTAPAIPATWVQTTLATDGGWKSGTALGSSYFPIPAHTKYLATNDDVCNCNKSNDFIHTPSFSLTSATFPVLKYDQFYYAAPQEIGTLEISTNGGTSWTVLETLAGAGDWVRHSTLLNAYVGMANVMIGFRYNDGGNWAYGFAIDTISVVEPPAKETNISSITMDKYVLPGNQNVTAVLQSFGSATVTSAILKYNIDGGAAVTDTFNLSIGYGASYNALFATQANLTAGVHTIKSWISDINGTGPDATPNNDTAKFQISVVPTQPAKSVLIEEFTGAWCGYCPRGGVTLASLTASDPKVIGVALHGGGPDQMVTTEGTTVVDSYMPLFPTGMIDRTYVASVSSPDYAIDDADWGTVATARENSIVPATVALSAISFNSTTRLVSATVTATFVGAVKGNYSVNCYLAENNVYGPLGQTTDNQWNQHSYFYNDATSPFHGKGLTTAPWSTSTAGLMPTDYVHNHVLDKMMGGAYGDNTVIPTTLVSAGQTFSKTFTYNLPAANPGGAHRFNPNNIYVIGLVEEYSATEKANRYVLNATEQKLNTNPEEVLSVKDIETGLFGTVSVYPNPISTNATINFNLLTSNEVSIEVVNAIGQTVSSKNIGTLSAGEQNYSVDASTFSNGLYFITIHIGNSTIVKKVSVNK